MVSNGSDRPERSGTNGGDGTSDVPRSRRVGDVGGTSGGLGQFLGGLALACAGGYLLTNQVVVTSSLWSFFGMNAFGLTLVPMLIGVGLLFFNGRSVAGWLLTGAGAVFIVAGVIAHLDIYFRPTSLFNTLLMLVLLAGGIGLIARSLRPHGVPPPSAPER